MSSSVLVIALLLAIAVLGIGIVWLLRQRAELAARNRSLQNLSSELDLQDLLTTILVELRQVVPYDSASVFELKGDYLELVSGNGFPNLNELVGIRFAKLDPGSPSSVVIQTRRPHILADAPEKYPRFNEGKHAAAHIRGWMGIPLIFGDELIGMLALDKHEAGFFNDHLANKVLSFATQAAIAMQNAKLYAETQRRADEMESLYKIGLEVTSNLDLDETLHDLFEHCRRILPLEIFYVAIFDEETQTIYHPLFYDHGKFKEVRPRDIRTNPGLTGYILRSEETLYIPNTLTPEAHTRYPIIHVGGSPSQCYVGVPLIANGRAIGVISMQSYTPNTYAQKEIRLFELIATQAAFAIQNSRLFEKAQRELFSRIQAEESLRAANSQLELQIREISDLRDQLREQAIRDPLTDLFNRRYLTETLERELDQARRAGTAIAIIIMDIDLFKIVNDAHGHNGGDQLLMALATLLQAHCRSGDIACRYGGEEFVVVLIDTTVDVASHRAEELRIAFHSLVIPHATGHIRATLSLGVAAFPLHGETGEAVLIKADQALYQAKQTGRNRVAIAP